MEGPTKSTASAMPVHPTVTNAFKPAADSFRYFSPNSSPDSVKNGGRSRSSSTSPSAKKVSALQEISANIKDIRPPQQQNFKFKPPTTSNPSPSKGASLQDKMPPPPKGSLKNNVNLPPPARPNFTSISPTKRPPLSVFSTSSHTRKSSLGALTPVSASVNKENLLPDEQLLHDALIKDLTGLSPEKPIKVAAPLPPPPAVTVTKPAEKKVKDTKSRAAPPTFSVGPTPTDTLPDPSELPIPEDDGTKPHYSYANLIGMALIRAPGRKLTLAHIYKWISTHFTFYKSADSGWQNSIRHNLSLSQKFIKVERPKDDPGKGNYWTIAEGYEYEFIKMKTRRGSAIVNSTVARKKSSQDLTATIKKEDFSIVKTESLPKPIDHLAVPATDDFPTISSDATIDEATLEPDYQGLTSQADFIGDSFTSLFEEGLPIPSGLLSEALAPAPSSPPIMHSSPPITRRTRSPGADRIFSSSKGAKRKRLSGGHDMDDSGYFSGLDSSVTRHKTGMGPPKKIRRGRAEEELARIRSSSAAMESPVPRMGGRSPMLPNSSSPLRAYDRNHNKPALAPKTPISAVKAISKPPASASPGANLRMHRNLVRNLVGSPIKGMELLSDEPSWMQSWDFGGSETAWDSNMFQSWEQWVEPAEPSLVEDLDNYFDTSFFQSPVRDPSPKRLDKKVPTTNIFEDLEPASDDIPAVASKAIDIVAAMRQGAEKIRSVTERPGMSRSASLKF